MSGQRIRDLREQACIGQTEFARMLGISQPHLANVEAGRNPLARDLQAFAFFMLRGLVSA